jgi:hypothetical protein
LYDGEVMPKGFTLGKIVNGFFITDGKIAKKVNNERGQMITVI